jgi:geranylgeranyl pyrophosphate synthase
MMTIVSEGFSTVVSLIESGQIEAVVGVACLESLEKVFPLLVDHAIPGVAIPLTKAGCIDTTVDEDMVAEAITMKSVNVAHSIDFEVVRKEVQGWFRNGALHTYLCPPKGKAGEIALDWLAGEGNRWRPSLLAAVYRAVSGDENFSEKVKIAAFAVESFHKASLVHDDIEDSDDFRYGKETVHKKHGIAAAINIGDLLLGQGYALLMKSVFDEKEKAELTRIASLAHCELCAGQGLDLEWSANSSDLNIETVIEIAKYKTVPAFRVAFEYGAMIGGATEELMELLKKYSEHLGIAYQLKDDIEDSSYPESLVNDIKEKLDYYRDSTLRTVEVVENISLRQLLFRLSNRILGE